MTVLITALRIAQGITALVILALSAYVANWYNMDTLTASPSEVNFHIVAPLLTFLSLAYLQLAPKFAPRATHPYASIAVDAFNAILYFAGFIVLAVFLQQLFFCRGSVCGAARATTVFSAGEFLLFAATIGTSYGEAFKGMVGRRNRGIAMQEKAAAMA